MIITDTQISIENNSSLNTNQYQYKMAIMCVRVCVNCGHWYLWQLVNICILCSLFWQFGAVNCGNYSNLTTKSGKQSCNIWCFAWQEFNDGMNPTHMIIGQTQDMWHCKKWLYDGATLLDPLGIIIYVGVTLAQWESKRGRVLRLMSPKGGLETRLVGAGYLK